MRSVPRSCLSCLSSLALSFAVASCSSEPALEDVAEAASGLASPIYLRPTDDATVVSGSHANTNYGNDPTLQVDLIDSEGGVERSFLRFAIGSVAGKIGRARLRLEVVGPSASTANLYKIPATAWNEDTITWNNRPSLGTGSPIATIDSTSAGQVIYLDVTGHVAPNSVVSFALVARSSDNADFASKEHPTARRPSLILDQITPCVPASSEPSALEICPAALSQSPQNVPSGDLQMAPGVTVTQLTNNQWNNIAYYDIPAVVPGSDRFVYSRVTPGETYSSDNYTATMTLDGSDPRRLTAEPASSANTFLTPNGAMAYFPRQNPVTNKVDIMAMDLGGPSCGATPISAEFALGAQAPRAQLSTASRSCPIDKWVIAFSTDHVLHRIKGKGAGGLWQSMGNYTLGDELATQPFHRMRLSPTCPNILMYSRNRTDGKGHKEIYLVDLDRDLAPYYLAFGQKAHDQKLTPFRRVPSHEMWSHDGLRVSYTQSTGCEFEPRQLVIGDVLNPDCTFRTVNPDGSTNLEGTKGVAARTFKGTVIEHTGDAAQYVPKFCSWSADDQLFACSGYALEDDVEGDSAIFLLNPATGATRFLTMTGERPGDDPYWGQSHLQFAGDKTTILFDSDRHNGSEYLPAQVYKATYAASMLP